jgi:hypothetical protein
MISSETGWFRADLRGLADPGRALDWLERAVGPDMYVAYLGIDPTFRSLHAEPRFRTLLKTVGLELRSVQ